MAQLSVHTMHNTLDAQTQCAISSADTQPVHAPCLSRYSTVLKHHPVPLLPLFKVSILFSSCQEEKEEGEDKARLSALFALHPKGAKWHITERKGKAEIFIIKHLFLSCDETTNNNPSVLFYKQDKAVYREKLEKKGEKKSGRQR